MTLDNFGSADIKFLLCEGAIGFARGLAALLAVCPKAYGAMLFTCRACMDSYGVSDERPTVLQDLASSEIFDKHQIRGNAILLGVQKRAAVRC